jgi:redox-sensitive bicupin YhaK (pirin superfamily)
MRFARHFFACYSHAVIIDGRSRDIGGFQVRRFLPARACPSVGPFVFFDHAGPTELASGHGLDVLPHPHIGLATVTYLFEGAIVHRDSLGSHQPIRPGDINWMTAGRGIAHSERTGPDLRRSGSRLNALQIWVGLPVAHEETEPEFHHHPAETLPTLAVEAARIRVLAGSAYGRTSPVHTFSPMFLLDVALPAGTSLSVPQDYPERALYVLEGAVECGTEIATPGRMLVFTPGAEIVLRASSNARIVLFGGAPLDGKRYLYWNFVSSSKERIEQAKSDWKGGKFPKIPEDDVEFTPLPE